MKTKRILAALFTVGLLLPTAALAQTPNTVTGTSGGGEEMPNGMAGHLSGRYYGNHASTTKSSLITTAVRPSTFSGSVSSVTGNSFVLATQNRGSQTVNTDNSTVFKETGQTSVSITNVIANENVSVYGVWDSTNNTVAASRVTIIVKTGSWTGTLAAVPSGNMLTLTGSNGTTYNVDVTNAKLVRHYGAAMQFSDYQQGDSLTVSGILNGTNITARIVRDNSLQARYGTFVGTVTAVSGSGFTLQNQSRGPQTINVASTTVFRESGVSSPTLGNISVNQTVTVSGVWDRTNGNVTATRVTIKVTTQTITGTLSAAPDGTTLTVAATGTNPTTYTVDASHAVFYYKGYRKANISILQQGDQLMVRGIIVSGSTNMAAKTVRDLSQAYQAPVSTIPSGQ